MNKIIICFVITIMILTVGSFAETRDNVQEIKDFVGKKGIIVEDENIAEVNFSDLPDGVEIEKLENTSIVIYEVNYSSKPFFVITPSDRETQGENSLPVCDIKSLLSFGFNGKMDEVGFLKMANGIQGSFFLISEVFNAIIIGSIFYFYLFF